MLLSTVESVSCQGGAKDFWHSAAVQELATRWDTRETLSKSFLNSVFSILTKGHP